MALQEGYTDATILENSLRTFADKPVVSLRCETVDGDAINCTIWLTPKAMGMARRQLKVCGFNVDELDLGMLSEDPKLLEGKRIPIEIEEYNGRMRGKVRTSEAPPKKQIQALQEQLRAKGSGADAEPDEDIPF